MEKAIDWDRVAKLDWIDKKARLYWVERERSDATPYFNMMAECVKPSEADYARATELADRIWRPEAAKQSQAFVHPFNSILGGALGCLGF